MIWYSPELDEIVLLEPEYDSYAWKIKIAIHSCIETKEIFESNYWICLGLL